MYMVNIHEAKTHLSKLVDKASSGESFVIAKSGKPMVRVVALDSPRAEQKKRIGFLANAIKVPDDFDQMGANAIEQLFGGTE